MDGYNDENPLLIALVYFGIFLFVCYWVYKVLDFFFK